MADNTALNAGTGGDVVRDIDRGEAKTQVVALDAGGHAGESLVSAANPMPTMGLSEAVYGANFNGGVTVVGATNPAGTLDEVSVDPFDNFQVVEANLSAAQSSDKPTFIALTGDPAGDFANVDFMSALFDPANGLAAQVNVVNPAKMDPNGATVLSDAPRAIPLNGTANAIFIIDTTGYNTIGFTTKAMVANITTSNDGLTWSALSGVNAAIAAAYVTSISANANYLFPCLARFVAVTVTTAGTATAYLRSQPWPAGYSTPIPYNLSQIAGAAVAVASAQIGTNFVNINGAVHSSTNPLYASLVAVAAANNQTIAANAVITATAVAVVQLKASAGRLTMLQVSNGSANVGYLHLINNAAATTSTASVMNIAIPATAGANISIILPDGGLYFSAGIAYTVSGAIASGDTAALTSPAIAVNAVYI